MKELNRGAGLNEDSEDDEIMPSDDDDEDGDLDGEDGESEDDAERDDEFFGG